LSFFSLSRYLTTAARYEPYTGRHFLRRPTLLGQAAHLARQYSEWALPDSDITGGIGAALSIPAYGYLGKRLFSSVDVSSDDTLPPARRQRTEAAQTTDMPRFFRGRLRSRRYGRRRFRRPYRRFKRLRSRRGRFGRRFRRTIRRYRGRRYKRFIGPYTRVRNQPIANTRTVSMRYTTTLSFTPTTNQIYHIRCDLLHPLVDAGEPHVVPRGYEEYSTLYKRYAVLGAKCMVIPFATSTSSILHGMFQSFNVCTMDPPPNIPTTVSEAYTRSFGTRPKSIYTNSENYGSTNEMRVRHTMYYSMQKNYKTTKPDGLKHVVGKNNQFYAMSPAKEGQGTTILNANFFQWWLNFLPYESTVTEVATTVLLDIRYKVIWFDRKYFADTETTVDATGFNEGLPSVSRTHEAADPVVVYDDRADSDPAA